MRTGESNEKKFVKHIARRLYNFSHTVYSICDLQVLIEHTIEEENSEEIIGNTDETKSHKRYFEHSHAVLRILTALNKM